MSTTPHIIRSTEQAETALDLRTLFVEEETALLRYAFSLIRRRAVAEEIVQDVFLQLHLHWDHVESPKAWLYQCVRNRATNHFRDHRKETLGAAPDECADREDNDSMGPPWKDDPMEILSRIEAMGNVRTLLNQLPQIDRQLVQLKYFEERSYREISQEVGISVGNVGYRLHHTLKALAVQLRQLGIDQES